MLVAAPSKFLDAEPLEKKATSCPPLAALLELTTTAGEPESDIASASALLCAARASWPGSTKNESAAARAVHRSRKRRSRRSLLFGAADVWAVGPLR
jgi:hypothetical protein